MAKKHETLSIRIDPELKRRVRLKLFTSLSPLSMTGLVESLFKQWLDTPVYEIESEKKNAK